MTIKEEVVIVYYDEAGHPEVIVHSNGAHTFYRLRKLNREDVAALLGAEPKVK